MKKFEWKSVLALALTGALALGLTACGSSDNGAATTGSNDAGSKAVYRTLDEIQGERYRSISVYSPIRIRSVMWMRTASIRDMMYIMQEDSVRIWVSM